MGSHAYEALRPTRRSRNTSVLWMLFSTVWVGILIGSLVAYWRVPDDSIYDSPPHIGFRLLATVLVAMFIGIYTYTLYRMYFGRDSWLVVFSASTQWRIRGSLLAIAIVLNLLPDDHHVGWHISFTFVAIAWALTSNHQNPTSAVFQVAAIAAVVMVATGREEILAGTLLATIAFGLMVAGYVMMNGLVGELMIERGRVADQAVTEERFRLARDLHDTVGHSMTQVTLKTELARRLIRTDPDRAERELAEVESLSRSLSAEVRRNIAGAVDLDLERECSRAIELLTSLDIEVTLHRNPADIPGDIADVLAWCLREGVMNVARHSGATRCDITLEAGADGYALIIRDNGGTAIGPVGQGLEGMKHRVGQPRGTVRLAGTEEGHRLDIRIPA